eukprot:TRINITY_DN3374_c0_g1_i2.p1 TRINITY_DN3374_c0_g1~~TRINITY_DN3374_c0_g1_i2.p1  ORF type:complete len:237 (-),score=31.86 TRINITY_DN3374_c0_g1_i2:8-718(-)
MHRSSFYVWRIYTFKRTSGLILALFALGLFVALTFCIVIKVSFAISTDLFVVKKHGVFRTSTLEFSLIHTSLHYFRTHFSEEQAWLQFVVKEGSQYYQIFSWKGKGNQKIRFLKLFYTVQRELHKWQARAAPNLFRLPRPLETRETEIVSRKEINLIGPFRQKLQQLSAAEGKKLTARGMQAERRGGVLSKEDVPVINLDKFLLHFGHPKTVPRGTTTSSPRSALHNHHLLGKELS